MGIEQILSQRQIGKPKKQGMNIYEIFMSVMANIENPYWQKPMESGVGKESITDNAITEPEEVVDKISNSDTGQQGKSGEDYGKLNENISKAAAKEAQLIKDVPIPRFD